MIGQLAGLAFTGISLYFVGKRFIGQANAMRRPGPGPRALGK